MTALPTQLNRNLAGFEQLRVHHDPERHALWYAMDSTPRPCFTPKLLAEIKQLQQMVAAGFAEEPTAEDPAIAYLVLSSAREGVFNLGGDLDLFRQLAETGDRAGLESYAVACIDVLYANATGLDRSLTTISLVQGSALGGGFEAALSSHVLIAERDAQMGLPEILFNLFPGMGAYSLLARRVGRQQARRMIMSGKSYSAEELFELGVVDLLAEPGEGRKTLQAYIKRHSRSANALRALERVDRCYDPISYRELYDIAMIWVDTAMRLGERELRTMERLVRAQDRLREGRAGSSKNRDVA